MKLIHQGAEAKIYRNGTVIIKARVPKRYRYETLDRTIRKTATRREVKLIEKARHLIPTPKILTHDDTEMTIHMSFIEGKKLRDVISFIDKKKVFTTVGESVAMLHNANIIHGDLTTSNILVHEKVYFIDFGLGFVSTKIEDKAVDIHLLRQALTSKHYQEADKCFAYVLTGYQKRSTDFDAVMKRVAKVEKRGRYKKK